MSPVSGRTKQQIELEFDVGLVGLYPSLMAMIRSVASNCGRPHKNIAADMDMSPSELSRKLAENIGDTHRFNVRDLEPFIVATGDRGLDVIYWLVERFLQDPDTRQKRALDAINTLAPILLAAIKEAGLSTEEKLKAVK